MLPKPSETQSFKPVPAARPLPPHLLPDYTFRECLSTSPLLDSWKVQVPSGKERMVQFLYGFSGPGGKTAQEAVNKLRSFQHPALVQTEIVHCDQGRLVLVTDLVKESLRDRFQQCANQKQPGVPRGELVDYLRAAAEVLDYLYHQHDLQHLGLNPRNLILDNGWLEIAEFGWVQVLWRPSGQDIAGRNGRYAAPELLEGQVSRACDQYSLAVIFAEMLTGAHPFRGQGRKRQQPDLAKLSETDRAVITRALDPEPNKRWASCIDMVLALEGTAPEEAKELQARLDHFAQMLQGTKQKFTPPQVNTTSGDLHRLIRSLLGETDTGSTEVMPPTYTNDGLALVHEFQAGIPLGTAKEKLELFSQEWHASNVRSEERRWLLQIALPLEHWWQRFFHQPALQVAVQLDRVNPLSATPIKVSMGVQVMHCPKTRGKQLLQEMAPALVESLRQLLLINAEKRTQERLLWPHPVQVVPLYSDGRRDDPIQCRGKDISHGGLGFYLPYDLTTPEILIELPNTICPPSLTIPATLVRAKRCADGWYEVGALFHLTALRESPVVCGNLHLIERSGFSFSVRWSRWRLCQRALIGEPRLHLQYKHQILPIPL